MTNFVQQLYKTILPYETRLRLYKLRHLQDYREMRTIIHPSSRGDFSLKPFDQYECIFVHITKTAGTSVAKSLFNYLPYHHTAIDYRVIYGKRTFNQYFKFAFVRNPWDRLYSAYRYLKSGGWNEDDKTWAQHNLSEHESFDSFIKNWLSTNNIKKNKHFWPQSWFICDNHNRLLIDYLAYFETINDDYQHISGRLGISHDISHHNANPGNSYKDVYDDKTRDIVAKIYADDIKLFGYDFDGIRHRRDI